MYIYKIILLSILIFVSCATPKPQGSSEEEILYKEAEQFIANNRSPFAVDKLKEIRARFPFSEYAKKAQLKLGDIAFDDENYIEAVVNYQRYRDLYPGTPEIPYVIFKLGESYFKQLPKTFDRDLEEAHQAIAYYHYLIQTYPSSEYVSQAKERKKECEEMLKNKEKYIADFYFKTKVYEGARYRYKKIMREFEDDNLLQYSMIRIVESSLLMKDKKSCERDAEAFLRVLNEKEQETKKKIESLMFQCEGL